MADPLQFGQIVWAEIADANGIGKSRPAVILTPTERIAPSGSIEVVAITSRLPKPIPENYVLLPWHAQGIREPASTANAPPSVTGSLEYKPVIFKMLLGSFPGRSCLTSLPRLR